MGKIMDYKSSLYNIALQCARLNDEGCSRGCECCQFNIFNYGLPINEASLLKANAYTDYHKRKQVLKYAENEINSEKTTNLIITVIIFGLIAWACSSVHACVTPQPADLIPEQEPILVQLRDNPNTPSNIPLIFQVMEKWGVPDLNEDGKVNCIDYSLWFRMLYGSNARLMINRNPRNGMNHMFVRVWYGFQIIDIEPQGSASRYSMGIIWGNKYDPQYNKDVTSQWSHVVGGMY